MGFVAPKGNQFAKNNKGGGRKGYEFEAEQYKRMLKMTDLYLALLEKILTGKPTTEERIRFEDVRQAMSKIIDKLHANKNSVELRGELELPIRVIKVKKYEPKD